MTTWVGLCSSRAAKSAKAVAKVIERFETACDDLEFFAGAGGSIGRLWCEACSYQVHGKGTRGGQHPEFATTARPSNRCCGCAGCKPIQD
jgi:hypothetical protein